MLAALGDLQQPPTSVLLAGDREACREWQRSLERSLRPTVRVFNVAGVALPAELAKGAAPADRAVAWVCRGTRCLPRIDDLAALEAEIST